VLAAGDGILAGVLDESSCSVRIEWVGVVKEISEAGKEAQVIWQKIDLTLHPTSAGQVYWRKFDWFNFSQDVVERYQLDEVFSKTFGEPA
jgi:hypothetical protein